ncbi:IclR family transcriptional regulator [candidate division KSB1 bacterium]|nr:IclR family transcriptional regulator [candidate division KSB1 bacterium]
MMKRPESFTGSKYHVPNLVRALQIVELLAEYPDGLNTSEIAEMLHYPKNSVFRITMTLLDHGYLLRENSAKKYRLSRKLLIIGYASLTEHNLIEKASPIMRELRDLTRETVPLGVLHGEEGVIIEQISGTHAFRFMYEPGKRFPLHASAPGKAILAFLPVKECEAILLKLAFAKFTERTIIDKDIFRDVLIQTRRQGYAIDLAEGNDGVHCVAAPIMDQTGYPIAAIWVTGPSNRLRVEDFDRTGQAVAEHAARISTSMGYVIETHVPKLTA